MYKIGFLCFMRSHKTTNRSKTQDAFYCFISEKFFLNLKMKLKSILFIGVKALELV